MKIFHVFFLLLNFYFANAQSDTLTSEVYNLNNLTKFEDENRISISIIKKGSTQFQESIRVHLTTLKPRHKLRPAHIQEKEEELIIVKEGKLTVTINQETKVLGPGSVIIILPGDEQMMNNLGDSNASYYVFIYRSKKPTIDSKIGKSIMLDWNETIFKAHDKGGRRDFFNRPTKMAERLEMHVTFLNSGLKSHEPHRHKAEEFILLIDGEATMVVDGKHLKGSKGDLFYLPSGSFHGIQNTGETQASYYAFQIN